MRTPTPESTATLSVRLIGHAALDIRPGGAMHLRVAGQALNLGILDARLSAQVQGLPSGIPFAALAASDGRDLLRIVQHLARRGLIEYRLARADESGTVIEPQVPNYWPCLPDLADDDVLVLSRFAYMRRRANELVLESPRSGALFRLGDPALAALLASLAVPQPVSQLREHEGAAVMAQLALLLGGEILIRVGAEERAGSRATEGDADLVLWDFHDLLFHARSTEGRHANPLGSRYPYVGVMDPLPAVRSAWPGPSIELDDGEEAACPPEGSVAALLRERRSVRRYDDAAPLTRLELARFLAGTARILATWQSPLDADEDSPMLSFTTRPYPSAGASYELELYLAIRLCDGLAPGYYHYDASRHALTPIDAQSRDCEALLSAAAFAMGEPVPPQVLITIAARFGRVSWKYSAVAYELILKNVGVLTQTFYLVATELELGGCAIGAANIELFSCMTGLPYHVEGAVGQFALGRGENVGEDPA